MHGAQRRWNAPPASQGADPPHRSQARRRRLLLHDLRLDDVELARQLARGRRQGRALRRCAAGARADNAMGYGGRGRDYSLWHQCEVSLRAREIGR